MRYGGVMWKGWFDSVHNTGNWMQAWKEEPYRSQYKQAIKQFAAFMRLQGAGRPMTKVEEDDNKITFTVDTCGSGGIFRQTGKYGPPHNFPTTIDPAPLTMGRSNFPFYCQHCAVFHYKNPIEWNGTIWPVMKPGEGDDHRCIMEFWKDPADIPEEYYKSVGKEKPTSDT
jgi:hypothetical protein